jgi:hypothetical protein
VYDTADKGIRLALKLHPLEGVVLSTTDLDQHPNSYLPGKGIFERNRCD